MGEIFVQSKEQNNAAQNFLAKILTNDIVNIPNNKAVYTLMLNYNAGIIDDLIVYKFHSDKFLLIVNASNIKKDYNWLINIQNSENYKNIKISNVSDNYSLLALQGPKSKEIILSLCGKSSTELQNLPRFRFLEISLKNIPCLIATTGYTGEDGYEILIENQYAGEIYEVLIKNDFVKPAGLGARDTLRIEAGLMLYGNDIDETTNPLEANLYWTLKGNGYIGEDIIEKLKNNGINKKIIGIEMIDKGICRQGQKIFINNQECGIITSGTHSPTLNKAIGIGYININYAEINTEIFIDIRGALKKALITKLPFYKKS